MFSGGKRAAANYARSFGDAKKRLPSNCGQIRRFLTLALLFFRAFHPYERPFIGKLCSSVDYHVIDVAGFSTAYLAKIVLKFPPRYENQRTRFEGRDSTARRG